ncbi:hypothetical protein LNV47_24570, partial [Paucibacter sp. DJ4R-1]|nr:hypothetical protein [Paucibacter sp. DJ4R-1]
RITMEIISRPFNGRNYWKKNGYTLLNGADNTHRKIQVVQIGGGEAARRPEKRVWRLKKARKVLVRLSPKRLWVKLREGYINMMLRVAGDVGRLNGGADFMGKRIPRGREVKGGRHRKNRVDDFEARRPSPIGYWQNRHLLHLHLAKARFGR